MLVNEMEYTDSQPPAIPGQEQGEYERPTGATSLSIVV